MKFKEQSEFMGKSTGKIDNKPKNILSLASIKKHLVSWSGNIFKLFTTWIKVYFSFNVLSIYKHFKKKFWSFVPIDFERSLSLGLYTINVFLKYSEEKIGITKSRTCIRDVQ